MAAGPPHLRAAVAVPGRRIAGSPDAGRAGVALRTGFPTPATTRRSTTERRAFDLLADGFGPGFNAPLLVVADLKGTGLAPPSPELAQRLAADPGIAQVGEPQVAPDGDTVVLPTLPTTGPADPATAQTLERVRASTPAGVSRDRPDRDDPRPDKQLDDTLPLFFGGDHGAHSCC